MKRVVQLRQKSDYQLKNRLQEIGNSLLRARGRNRVGSPTDGSVYGGDSMFMWKLRREKARILTILNERERKKRRKPDDS